MRPDPPHLMVASRPCSLGSALVAGSGRGVRAILLGDDPAPLLLDLQARFPEARLVAADAAFEPVLAAAFAVVEAPSGPAAFPLDLGGTPFQRAVWAALGAIPPGRTASYTEVAHLVGRPQSVRAVAQACGANALAVAIPCHRVVRADGGLSGYRWGVARKAELLRRERAAAGMG